MPLIIHPHDLSLGTGNQIVVKGDQYQVSDQTDEMVEAIYRAPGSNERLFLWLPKTWIESVNGDWVVVSHEVSRQAVPA